MNKVKLGEVLDVKRGASLSGDYYSESGEKIRLTLGNFDYPNGGFKENTSKSDIYFTGEVKPEFILKKGDIITPLTEQVAGLLGETARIPEDDLYIQSGDVGLVIPNESKLDNKYAYYLLASPLIKRQLGAAAQQTKIRHTSPDKIKDCEAWLPSLEYQKKAGELLDDINFKMKCNNKINAELESMAKTIYDYWFLQFEFPNEEGKPYKSSGGKMVWNEELKREIPEGWEVSHVKDCIKHINTGLNPRDNFVLGNGSIKYITVKNLTTDGTIDFSGCDMIDEEARVIVHNRSDVSKNDILFASIAPLGRCAIVHENPTDWDINESVFCIRPNNNIVSTEYLYMFFMSDYFIKKAEHNSTGSVFSGIRISSLEDMIITIPPEKIKDNFVKAIREALYMKYENEKQNQELASLRDFLLPMLMNGQIGFK